jgi:hydroxymethylbilane synthase
MIGAMREIVVGTRGSALARWQAEWVCGLLSGLQIQTRLQVIQTSGDKHLKGSLADKGGKGLFVKELETALQRHEIGIAVHSLKDVTTLLDSQFVLGALLPRADPRDCLIAVGETPEITKLPLDSVIGSCSPRRIAQILHLRPGLQVEPLRGNVETRLSKVRSGLISATFLAKAGLDRLGIEDSHLIHPLPTEIMLPAAGQGIVAVETCVDDLEVLEILQQIDHVPSRLAAEAERGVVHALGGSCVSPIAAHAVIHDEQLTLHALVGDLQGETLLRESIVGPVVSRLELASCLVERLLSRGAGALIGGVAS